MKITEDIVKLKLGKFLMTCLFFIGQAAFAAEEEGMTPYQAAQATYNIAQYEHATNLLKLREAQYTEGLRYEKAVHQNAITALEGQDFYGRVVLFMVLLLVVGGFVLAWFEFRKGTTIGETSFEITREGVKIRSAFVGLMILFFSLLFFYLFITEVYGIKVQRLGETPKAEAPAKGSGAKGE